MRAAGPVVDPVPCSGCGKLLDPLRAGHVAIFDLKFHFFCNRHACRASFLGEPPSAAPQDARRDGAPIAVLAPRLADADPRAALDAPIVAFHAPATGDALLPELPPTGEDRALVEPIARTILTEEPTRLDVPEPRDIGALLLVIATIAGTLAVALALAGEATLVIGARIVLAAVGAGMLVGRAATTPRDACDPHPAPILAPPLISLVLAIWAALRPDRALGAEAASLAGIIVTATAAHAWLLESARGASAAERMFVAMALAVPGRRAPEEGAPGDGGKGKVFDICPGELVLVETGEVVPVDLVVASGEVEVLPWLGATTPVRRRAGDAVVAGAKVVRGRLRGTCTFVGNDRSFARVLLDPRRRADALAPIAQASRALAERWAIAAALIGGLSAFVAGGRGPIEIAMTAAAVHAALATAVIAGVAGVHVARGILLAQRRGIAYKSADAWDRAGKVTVAVFCARGTLLLGEPELAELEATGGKLEPADVLSLAAGAERGEEHPIATAIVRAAQTRGARPDGVRNAHYVPGLGVTAVTSSGEDLCVGSRPLLLAQRISIAAAEQRIAELEALGRTVVLVAVGTRLVGVLGLQDGLRPGARAAVQHLLDAQIEPVIMSGDARETCEAIGRSLDVDHIRPEVLPADRAAEVRRLIDAGTSVAVLGHPGVDDGALGAADVAVALGAAGASPGDLSVALASDDVRDAALSLALAHRSRIEARVALAIAVVPALIGAIAVAFGVLPPAYAPLTSLLGGAMAVMHVRALDRVRDAGPTRSHA
ncbi:HAD-IC family P-type ATPase [Polyangium aurulentum]|uniref:HAD-IC family P-type ATPase n=1 Tax=Polyangium aurulentum TaxID=2567896 RepID=UPI0010AE63F0|nr:HAD-IC family P-type ATPase [Polyangium aurulentum]UQA62160.1 HAD-IC family P-type ATPase [Polyangium aurulentum]